MPDLRLPQPSGRPDQPPKLMFTWLISEVVAVMLKDHGFAKSALTWVRRRQDLIDVINLQGSTRNGLIEHSFFINVALLSPVVLDTVGIAVPPRPKVVDGLYRKRAGQISGSHVDRIDITPTTDRVALAEFLRGELAAALGLLDRIRGTADLIDLVVERNGAANSDIIAGYLVRVGDDARLLRYLTSLRNLLEGRANWPGIATRLRWAMGERAPVAVVGLLPEEIVAWVNRPDWLT